MGEVIEGGGPFYVLERPMTLGEGPIYRESDHTLHYNDCLYDPPQMQILALDPLTGEPVHPHHESELAMTSIDKKNVTRPGLTVVEQQDSVTVTFFREKVSGSYICAYYQGIAFLDEHTGQLEILKEIIPTNERHIRRFNDGAVDCKGRFWAAEIDVVAMSYGPGGLPKEFGRPCGRLWRYDPDGSLTYMEDGLVCGNGLAWSPDNKIMYLNDSMSQLVYSYDFDVETGAISNKTIFIDRRLSGGEPDGMVADTAGNLWIAMYGFACVMVFNAKGDLIKTIKFPARNMTCTTWGGKDNNIIYAVSGYNKLPNRSEDDLGGQLFMYKTNFRGMPKYKFAG